MNYKPSRETGKERKKKIAVAKDRDPVESSVSIALGVVGIHCIKIPR